MYSYVWGVLISAFIMDILRSKFESKVNQNETLPPEEKIKPTGMEIKLDGDQKLKVEYEGKPMPIENVLIKIQYCTS